MILMNNPHLSVESFTSNNLYLKLYLVQAKFMPFCEKK